MTKDLARRDSRRTLPGLWIILGLASAQALIPPVSAAETQLAALTPDEPVFHEAELPTVLSAEDIARYRHIFELQQAGDWQQADRWIATLRSRLLIGEVLAQRYRSPRYHASYAQLTQWLKQYGAEPQAKAIYSLALNRKPHDAAPPPRPGRAQPATLPGEDIGPEAVAAKSQEKPKALSPEDASRAAALESQIRVTAENNPPWAEELLEGADAKTLLTAATRDALRAMIAQSYLGQDEPQRALAVATKTESASYTAVADWQAGLAAWRLGRLEEARRCFQALARSRGQSQWIKSAAAFWAARVELRAGRPQNYGSWLRLAAENPHTFYGVLARHLLGIDQDSDDSFTQYDAQIILGLDTGKRILALLAVGQNDVAAGEIEQLAAHSSPVLLQSLAALADRANLTEASAQITDRLADDGASQRDKDSALYPVPRWEPLGGFTVDRALLYALMRQESQFAPTARNASGATGLMQLMPDTARSMAKRAGRPLPKNNSRKTRAALNDPEYNLMLAQEYVKLLLHDTHIRGNLILFAAAYNRGPNAVAHWDASSREFRKDPLLFIESIPAKESRVFTLRVLTNYWIYRQRLNQPTPDLDALAANKWPTYVAQDAAPTRSVASR